MDEQQHQGRTITIYQFVLLHTNAVKLLFLHTHGPDQEMKDHDLPQIRLINGPAARAQWDHLSRVKWFRVDEKERHSFSSSSWMVINWDRNGDYLGSGSKQGQQKKLFDRELRNYSGDNGSFDGRVM